MPSKPIFPFCHVDVPTWATPQVTSNVPAHDPQDARPANGRKNGLWWWWWWWWWRWWWWWCKRPRPLFEIMPDHTWQRTNIIANVAQAAAFQDGHVGTKWHKLFQLLWSTVRSQPTYSACLQEISNCLQHAERAHEPHLRTKVQARALQSTDPGGWLLRGGSCGHHSLLFTERNTCATSSLPLVPQPKTAAHVHSFKAGSPIVWPSWPPVELLQGMKQQSPCTKRWNHLKLRTTSFTKAFKDRKLDGGIPLLRGIFRKVSFFRKGSLE